MTTITELETIRTKLFEIPDAPAIDGLTFRGFQGEEDYPKMLAVINGSKKADQDDRSESLEDLRRNYEHLVNCDPAQDMVLVEVKGETIGYGRVWWQQIENGPRTYTHFAFLLPAWRGKGIRRAMLRHNEARLTEIAARHTSDAPKAFEAWAAKTEEDWTEILKSEGYEPVRYGFAMVRPIDREIPDHPLPDGLEVRDIQPGDYDKIWSAAREAFRDHWGFSEAEWADTHFEAWQQDPTFTPQLWQVAWDGDEVAGMILNFINEAENKEYDRKRGYTETICVRRPWRRRGLARALIARSLKMHKALGMTETALGVDAQNPNGALHLYESMGYEVVKQFVTYRKPLDAEWHKPKEKSDAINLRARQRDA
jgi:GNAT superfamily N-acetyltransferase